MTALEAWDQRPAEEANLFNPAFLGSLVYEFVKSFQKARPEGVPLTYLPLALAISLHRPTRVRLPSRTVTSLYEWVQDNEDILVGFHNRALGLLPYVRESLLFSIHNETIQFGGSHLVQLGRNKAHFTSAFMEHTTNDVVETVKRTQFLARWLLTSGSESSILSCWGIRP